MTPNEVATQWLRAPGYVVTSAVLVQFPGTEPKLLLCLLPLLPGQAMAEAEAEENGEEGDVFREPLTPAPGRTVVCAPWSGGLAAPPALWEETEQPQLAPSSPAVPLAPEHLPRVLEQVRKAPPPSPRPLGTVGSGLSGSCGFSVVQDAARRLQDAAQQVAQHWGPDAPPPPPRLLQPKNCDSKEVGTLLESEEKNGNRLACWGSRRTKGSKRCRKLKASVKSSCSGKHSNSVHPTSCTGGAAEQNVVGNKKAELKELLQQCDHGDLMELVLPHLSKLVTVYEFLLMKVEKSHLAKPFFPDVYKEFEELHKMVKKMCQDYFGSSVLSSQQPLEIKNNEVAESLGITEELLRKKEKNSILPQTILSAVEVGLGEITGQKREKEILEEVMVPVKRTRIESGSKNMNHNYISHGGLQEKTTPLCNQVNAEGFNLQLNRTTSQFSEETYNVTVDAESQMFHADQLPKTLADAEGKNESVDSVTLYQAVNGIQTCSQLENPGDLLQEQTELFPACVQNHSPDFHNTTLSARDSTWSGYEIQNRRENEECKSHQEFFNPGNETNEITSQPERILPADFVTTANSYQISSESQHHPLLEASLSTEGILESPENLDQFPESLQDNQREQENAIAVSETLAFEITDETQELSQGHEQIFIQTSDGLILSHPDTAVSEANDIVIVTDVDGTAVHISTPDGLPLETLEALLAVDKREQE
ncbi:zinc finger protein 839 isoform X3 [Monodelphis domestica]|uniref:zinc finger protein 839 isoform X3 n=1 Tax=Monodelphis domestica TaxID=13616 RepID=UPI0024E21178|nr:zinc finger protein 839 isoform X3 [Monodelphis domestica]